MTGRTLEFRRASTSKRFAVPLRVVTVCFPLSLHLFLCAGALAEFLVALNAVFSHYVFRVFF